MITVFSISLLYLKLCLNMDRLIISLNCTSFHLSLIIVILGFKVICYSQDFWQKSPLMFMITAICYLRLTYKLTMFFDALEFWSANFCQATAHETSHPTECRNICGAKFKIKLKSGRGMICWQNGRLQQSAGCCINSNREVPKFAFFLKKIYTLSICYIINITTLLKHFRYILLI